MMSLGQQGRLVYMWRRSAVCLCVSASLCQSWCAAKDNSCKTIRAGIVGIEKLLTCTAVPMLACLLVWCLMEHYSSNTLCLEDQIAPRHVLFIRSLLVCRPAEMVAFQAFIPI